MENFILNALVNGLSLMIQDYNGIHIDKVYQLDQNSIIFNLNLPGYRFLHLSVAPTDGRFYLTNQRNKSKSTKETPFLQRLRKYLSNAYLIRVEKLTEDRSITLILKIFGEDNSFSIAKLRLDIMGSNSNIYLLDEDDRILDLLKSNNRLNVGDVYSMIPQKQIQVSWDEVKEEKLSLVDNSKLEEELCSVIRGCTKTLAREIVFRSLNSNVWDAFLDVRKLLETSHKALLYSQYSLGVDSIPSINPRQTLVLSTFPLEQYADWFVFEFQNIHEVVSKYFYYIDLYEGLSDQKKYIQKSLINYLKRLSTAQQKVLANSVTDEEIEQLKKYGELIYANLKTGKRTEIGFEVVDYYLPEPKMIEIPIPSNEQLTVAAQKYFEKYQKHQRAKISIQARSVTLRKQIHEAKSLLEQISASSNNAELNDVIKLAEQILPFELLPRQTSEVSTKKATDSAYKFRHYLGPDGFDIFVGRNDRDNDLLTFKFAQSRDIWLHAADYPGSHVLIRNKNKSSSIPHNVIFAAAEIAAFFSQAKNEGKVNVHYTERKNLSRPRNAKPGSVLLTKSKTLLVAPKEVLKRAL